MNKKKEYKNIVLLLCIIFAALNYMLYIYTFSPKINNLNDLKEEYLRHSETKEMYETKLVKKNNLEKEIEELEPYVIQFEQMVLPELDTIQMAYDYYIFFKKQEVFGDKLYIDLAREQAQEEKSLYDHNEITVTVNLEKTKLSKLLQNLMNASSQIVFLQSIAIDVSKEEIEEHEAIDESSISYINIDEYIIATFIFRNYVNGQSIISNNRIEYSFYENQENYNSLTELFCPQNNKE